MPACAGARLFQCSWVTTPCPLDSLGSCLRDACVYGVAILSQKLSKPLRHTSSKQQMLARGLCSHPRALSQRTASFGASTGWTWTSLPVDQGKGAAPGAPREAVCSVTAGALTLQAPSTSGPDLALGPLLQRVCSASPSQPRQAFAPTVVSAPVLLPGCR